MTAGKRGGSGSPTPGIAMRATRGGGAASAGAGSATAPAGGAVRSASGIRAPGMTVSA
ncbi:hypothetical protein [Sphingomonas hankookensis]|uniref:hypothetical protein n=1 Tax=Sphingomonas hankookensis TaxID=563996 RepID=UPI003F79E8CB